METGGRPKNREPNGNKWVATVRRQGIQSVLLGKKSSILAAGPIRLGTEVATPRRGWH